MDLLRYVRQNSCAFNIDNNLGFECYVANDLVRISADDTYEFIYLRKDNFTNLPGDTDLINIFSGIRAYLDNQEITRKFYQNDLPKERNMIFIIISYSFLTRTGGWSGHSKQVQ